MTTDAEARRYIEWAEADVPKDRTFEDWHDKGTVFLRDTLARLSHDRGADALPLRPRDVEFEMYDPASHNSLMLGGPAEALKFIQDQFPDAALSVPAPTLPALDADPDAPDARAWALALAIHAKAVHGCDHTAQLREALDAV